MKGKALGCCLNLWLFLWQFYIKVKNKKIPYFSEGSHHNKSCRVNRQLSWHSVISLLVKHFCLQLTRKHCNILFIHFSSHHFLILIIFFSHSHKFVNCIIIVAENNWWPANKNIIFFNALCRKLMTL